MTATRAGRRALGLLLVLAGCGAEGPGPGGAAGAAPPPVGVEVVTVVPQVMDTVVEAVGTTLANESVTVTAKVTETVRKVKFEDGERVEAGAVLVELTDDEQTALLAEAEANLADARRQLRRLEDLLKDGSVPVSQVDAARARHEAEQGRLDSVLARLDDRLIRAPFGGVLGFRQVSEGTLVTPGSAIVTLDDIATIKLDFAVPELWLGALRPGLAVTARSVAWPDQPFPATVRSIGSRVDPVTRTVPVRALIDNAEGRLRPGMLLGVELAVRERTVLAVPEEALLVASDQAAVFVVNESIAERRPVRTGQRDAGRVEIVAGLRAGEVVVSEGTVKLRDGQPVRIDGPAPAAAEPAG